MSGGGGGGPTAHVPTRRARQQMGRRRLVAAETREATGGSQAARLGEMPIARVVEEEKVHSCEMLIWTAPPGHHALENARLNARAVASGGGGGGGATPRAPFGQLASR